MGNFTMIKKELHMNHKSTNKLVYPLSPVSPSKRRLNGSNITGPGYANSPIYSTIQNHEESKLRSGLPPLPKVKRSFERAESPKGVLPRLKQVGALPSDRENRFQNPSYVSRSVSIDPKVTTLKKEETQTDRGKRNHSTSKKYSESIDFEEIIPQHEDQRFSRLLGSYVQMVNGDNDILYLGSNFPSLYQECLEDISLKNIKTFSTTRKFLQSTGSDLSKNSDFSLPEYTRRGEESSFSKQAASERSIMSKMGEVAMQQVLNLPMVSEEGLFGLLEEGGGDFILTKPSAVYKTHFLRLFIRVNRAELEAGFVKFVVYGDRLRFVDVAMFYVQKIYRKVKSTWERIFREVLAYFFQRFKPTKVFLRALDVFEAYLKFVMRFGGKLERTIKGDVESMKVFAFREEDFPMQAIVEEGDK
eukprot:TRINITY_DN12171_c0_g1_i1.p1 TRINITY_DN12171_c0_g1~~TRINITY_DN12171_c0_g1_i1.p1  ORF type:complete len:416 (+),score=80.00 TRINITY_DN12171_c0_g1_i1:98-1345(+)